jgi:predicted nucleotidyltransferase
MIQQDFAEKIKTALREDITVIGLAAAGSWLTDEMDEYSDLDLIVVTRETLNCDKDKMLNYANRFGHLISAFTGEHVGEPRLLICLYDEPLLHVDLKFLTLAEFQLRVEDPVILLDTDDLLLSSIESTVSEFPRPDFQWIEDRFWTWVHYCLTKIGRGEYFEALDFLASLRGIVFGPLLHLKNNNEPRGLRRVESKLSPDDFAMLEQTLGSNSKESLMKALINTVELYRQLRVDLYEGKIQLNNAAEEVIMKYFLQINGQKV